MRGAVVSGTGDKTAPSTVAGLPRFIHSEGAGSSTDSLFCDRSGYKLVTEAATA